VSKRSKKQESPRRLEIAISRAGGPHWICSKCSRDLERNERFLIVDKSVVCVECFVGSELLDSKAGR